MAINNLRLKNLFDRYGYLEENDPQVQSQQMEPLFPQPVRPVPMQQGPPPEPIPDLNLDPYINNKPEEIFLHELDPRNVTDDPGESGKRFAREFTPPPPIPPSRPDPLERFKNWNPETGASDAFNKYISEMPQRQDPGILRRIAASAASIRGGPKAAEEFMYGGYDREMEDWKARGGPLHQAANLERYSNVNERQLQGQMSSAELAQQRIDETERKNRESADIQKSRLELDRFKTQNPTWKYDTGGPTIIALHPTDPNKNFDTGIKTGSMSQLELENLRTGRATGVASIYANRSATDRPGDAEKRTQNVLREQFSRNSKYSKFIEDNGDGTYSLSNPAKWWGNVSQQELNDYAELLDMAFGEGQQPVIPPGDMSRVPSPPTRGSIGPDITGDESNMSVIPSTGTGRSTGAGPVGREPRVGDKVVAGEPIRPGTQAQPQQKPIIQFSESTKSYRGSLDGGKTWVYSTDGKTWTTTPPKKAGG